MGKTILITGSTDGIGLATAETLSDAGHKILLHGRSQAKLESAALQLDGPSESYVADLSDLAQVNELADKIIEKHASIDVLINNAGIFKTPNPRTKDGFDIRFVVNTIAPYVLTRRLAPVLGAESRIVNVSSAAQALVNIDALMGRVSLSDMEAYAQSKLAITMWTKILAKQYPSGPLFVAVNPGSLLASKMVRDGFGVAGNNIGIGADILSRASLSNAFASHSGDYYDNDQGKFATPHPAVFDTSAQGELTEALNSFV